MKRSLIALLMLSAATQSILAVKVVMPNEEVIAERLEKAMGSTYFNEKTKLSQKLANSSLEALGVAVKLNLALYDFDQNVNNPMISVTTRMLTPCIFEALLLDYPEALKELKEHGIYKPISKQ